MVRERCDRQAANVAMGNGMLDETMLALAQYGMMGSSGKLLRFS